MIIYYSGDAKQESTPENILNGEASNIMLTFFKNRKKIEPRFRRLLKKRKKNDNILFGM